MPSAMPRAIRLRYCGSKILFDQQQKRGRRQFHERAQSARVAGVIQGKWQRPRKILYFSG